MRFLCGTCVLLFVTPVFAADPQASWAFKSYAPPDVPTVQNAKVVRNPIDAFLLAELEKKNLGFAPEADKVTLLRRVTFDLTGLPPTIAEVEAFLKDTSANAFEKVVDRLLASPRFGERTALFWLDVVRFAETDGFKADDKRPNAWRYRDYVIQSFNADKPYDRFVKEQIAGDELYPDDPNALIATGFLRHYPDEYNAVNLEQRRQEILNDITDTTAATFLGVTVGCAKCHDHKFDPILQEDYYRLQAHFVGWKPAELPLLNKEQREAYEKRFREWQEKTASVRKELASLEKPFRDRAATRQRGRFPVEYAKLLDVPEEQRTPLEKQIGWMIEKQVYTAGDKAMFTGMKPEEKERHEQLKKQLADLGTPPPEPERVMAFTDMGLEVPVAYSLKRGDWKKRGEAMKPGFISTIDDRDSNVKPTAQTTGRRTALAEWMVQPDHPLTARVMVNRIWQQYFARGIVGTASDFGKQGDRPTHPQLLNWLASEFVRPSLPGSRAESAWTLKRIHRLIVTSTAYRQTSTYEAARVKADPENALFSRQNRKRLDGEAIRDAMLAVSGVLNLKMGGPSISPDLPTEIKPSGWTVTQDVKERNRRSIYVYVKRNLRYPLFAAFDAPDRCETCDRRFVTTTAPQALMLLNEKLIHDEARALAERVLKETGNNPELMLERLFRTTLAREPQSEERIALRNFVEKRSKDRTLKDAAIDLSHALLNLNEFVYID